MFFSVISTPAIKNMSTKQDNGHFWRLLTADLFEIWQGEIEREGIVTVSVTAAGNRLHISNILVM